MLPYTEKERFVAQDAYSLEQSLSKANAEASAEVVERKAQVAEVHAKLKEALTKGETTGDVVKDVLLYRAPEVDARELSAYAALNQSLAGRAGQLVLVVYIKEVCVKHTFTGHGNKYERGRFGTLGVLEGEKLEARYSCNDGALLLLPTANHVSVGLRHAEVVAGKLSECSAATNHEYFTSGEVEKIVVGDDEVFAYAQEGGFTRSVVQLDTVTFAALQLGGRIPEKVRLLYRPRFLEVRARIAYWLSRAHDCERELRACERAVADGTPFSPDGAAVFAKGERAKVEKFTADMLGKVAACRIEVASLLYEHGGWALQLLGSDPTIERAKKFIAEKGKK